MDPGSPQESGKVADPQQKRNRGFDNKLVLKNIKESTLGKDSDTDMRTRVSPNSSIMSKLSKRLKNRFANGYLRTQGVYSPTTKVSDMPFTYKTYNTIKQI